MANVIDRLRVQGNPAPRNPPSQPGSGMRRFGVRSGGERGEGPLPGGGAHSLQFTLSHSHLQNRDCGSGRSMNQAARRLEHLQRVQLANQGLSSMDVRQPDLPGKNFMLRGKPASADALLHRHHLHQHQQQQQQQQQQEWTSGSAGSGGAAPLHAALMRARSKAAPDTVNGFMPPTRSELREGAAPASGVTSAPSSNPFPSSSLRPPHPASATSYFLLANPHTLHPPQNSRSAQAAGRSKAADTVAGQGLSSGESTGVGATRQQRPRHSAGSAASFELTGHQVMTPRSNRGNEDGLSFRDFSARSPRPRLGVKDVRYSSYRDRRSPGLKDATTEPPPVDPNSLRQCLHVQQSAHPDSATEVHKHLAQFTRTEAAAKINYNNPYYRQARSKERPRALPESERRYIFDSVASYIHFNKIYPSLKDPSSSGSSHHHPTTMSSAAQKPGLFPGLGGKDEGGHPRVPQLAGFPKHCTDTILLRMMFELNKPGAVHGIGLGHQAAGAPSMRSTDCSTKFSDIGRHRDLDEFTVQGETSSFDNHHHHLPPPSQGITHDTAAPRHTEEEEDVEEEVKAGSVGEEEQEEEETSSTLITATTPGRPRADDADDADDEASQWNAGRVRGCGCKQGQTCCHWLWVKGHKPLTPNPKDPSCSL
ncbi:uncharacterized protein LOC143283568 [Babylonia areolata]|uniref:uncharacterized protein LOC143283568 n=1 Tax=Babylonia areolata TaxID=304850 RepID=UPI003FD153F5